MKSIQMIGKSFGRLLVIADAVAVRKRRRYLCQCECGTSKVIDGASMRSGAISSCGCLHREVLLLPKTHGGATGGGTRAYRAWKKMLARCNNQNNKDYGDYGGRGIQVHPSWNSFETFLADMGDCPPTLTLDRINNDGHYQQGNCQWATRKQQASNRRPRRRK